MNKNKIIKYQIISILLCFVLGTIFHFTFEISGGNKIVAIFSAVNQSTWEHLKLIFFPMVLSTVVGYFYIGKDVKNYFCSKTIGILSAMAFTVIFFYTYTGIIGKNISFIDISIFFVAVILGDYIAYLCMINNAKCNNIVTKIILVILFICFILFTFNPPKIGLFKDPITKGFGIFK